ncbi:MAG: type II toxin-antitoxin system Phd/YefM family antitoxin [Desulfonatronovibrio sp.]
MQHWPIQNAKNCFSSLVKACLNQGPQIVTKRGKEAAVLLSIEEYRRLVRSQDELIDFFQHSPLKDFDLDLERSKEPPREIEL